jgi:hypothetical protein
MDSDRDTPLRGWVAPFGDPWINARSRLPKAFRSVPRPSSPLGAKASTRCPSCPSTPASGKRTPKSPRAFRGPHPPTAPRSAKREPRRQVKGNYAHSNTQAYPCQNRLMPKRRKDQEEGMRRRPCRHPSPRTPRAETPKAHERAPSSPPHDVQRARPRPGRRSPPNGLPPAARAAGEEGGLRGAGPKENQATNARRPRPQGTGDGGLVGLGRLERPTSRLSGVRSNQLSYRPESHPRQHAKPARRPGRPRHVVTRLSVVARRCADGGGPFPTLVPALLRRRAGSP